MPTHPGPDALGLATGNRQLATTNEQLATGNDQLATGRCQLIFITTRKVSLSCQAGGFLHNCLIAVVWRHRRLRNCEGARLREGNVGERGRASDSHQLGGFGF